MDDKYFVQKLLETMEVAKPPKINVNEILTDQFVQKHTQFSSFQEMLQAAIKESGLLETYIKNIKETINSKL